MKNSKTHVIFTAFLLSSAVVVFAASNQVSQRNASGAFQYETNLESTLSSSERTASPTATPIVTPTFTRSPSPTATATSTPRPTDTPFVITTPTVILVPGDYSTLQDAYNAAYANDTILVADGTYSGNGNRDIWLFGKTVVFRSVNGPETTIIDCGGSATEPHRGFVTYVNITNNSIFDGFTLRNSYVMPVQYPYNRGGAFSLAGSGAPAVTNCIVTNNFSQFGGAIFCGDNTASVSNCVISHNSAAYSGGGILVSNRSHTIHDCSISFNTAGTEGGGIYINLTGNVILERCELRGNRASMSGGGLGVYSYATATIGNSQGNGNYFADNYAASGADLFSEETNIQARYNTFSGFYLSDYYVSPRENFNLSGCVSELVPITQEVYTSPLGDDANDGVTPETPFKTIRKALSQVYGTSSSPVTVHLAPGEYSSSSNGEWFPLPAVSHVILNGAGSNLTTITANYESLVFWVYYDTAVAIKDVLITGGSNINGGALSVYSSSITLQNCTVMQNSALYEGGGMDLMYASLALDNCYFFANSAGGAGGAVSGSFTDCLFSKSAFRYNSTNGSGAAVYLSVNSSITCNRVVMELNSSNYGGGLYVTYSTAEIYNSLFARNYAVIYGGGAAGLSSSILFSNCLFTENTAQQGAAVTGCDFGDPMLYSCTLVDNYSTNEQGSGVYVVTVLPFIVNSILWNLGSSEIYGATARVFYSDVKGGYTGDGNINSDPLFVHGMHGDYYLSHALAGQPADSPCIDACNELASEACFPQINPEFCLDELTTRTDNVTDNGILDMGFHYPANEATPTLPPSPTWGYTKTPLPSDTPTHPATMTATPTTVHTASPTIPVPTPTETPALGVELVMPATLFVPGDPCWLKAFISNPGPDSLRAIDFYVMLDLDIGYYWFYPTWSQYPPDIDFVPLPALDIGIFEETIIPEFEWPSGVGSYPTVHFYGALVNSDSATIIGSMGSCTFGYGI